MKPPPPIPPERLRELIEQSRRKAAEDAERLELQLAAAEVGADPVAVEFMGKKGEA